MISPRVYKLLGNLRDNSPGPVSALLKASHRAVNVMLARKPEFVIIGTGRSGSSHISEVLRASGYPCSHEAYYTPDGPTLRNPERSYHYRGDSSWLAVPYLPDPDIIALHQVRHPLKVIRSLFNSGFFDENYRLGRSTFAAFARRHFDCSDDPLQSCLRWYIEWNERCEAITDKRYAVENLENEIGRLSQWLGKEIRYTKDAVSKDTNNWPPAVENPIADVHERIKDFPEYSALLAMAERYGYEI